jgi:hypothetical protein
VLPLTRRQLFGGGLLLGAGYISAQIFGHRPLGELDSPFLDSSARRTLLAACEALLPTLQAAEWATGAVDDFLAQGDPILAGQLRMALGALEHWPGGLRMSRFSRLSVQERRQVLTRWGQSPLGIKRQIAVAVTKTVLFTHYAHPDSWAAIGYPGPMEAS